MMSHIVRTILVLALVLSPSLTRAEEQRRTDGNQLLKDCEAALSLGDRTKMEENNPSFEDTFNTALNGAHCFGFLEGMRVMNDMAMQVQQHQNIQSMWRVFCPPQKVILGQLVRVVVKYLKDHPADLHRDNGFLTIMAFGGAFPCEKSEN